MDEKDFKIARLEGQVEAYQEQLRSLAIELLRRQVKDLQASEIDRRADIVKLHKELGALEERLNQRLTKASAAFVELRQAVEATGDSP